MYEELKETVCRANIELRKQKLVIYSWGNVSGIDRTAAVVAVKPSGVAYDKLTPEKIVLLDLDGNILEKNLKPSSDTPAHLELYRNFKSIGGVCHTHSPNATMWAQACREIPCLGTTHADYFYGPVPVTDMMTEEQIKHYVTKENPIDCAGSFKIEGLGIALMEKMDGNDYTSLIGLPLILLVNMLSHFDVEVL